MPKELFDLAMESSWFKNSRFKGGKGKGVGGAGLGFKDRPALGYSGSASSQDDTSLSEQFKYDKKHKEGMAKAGSNASSGPQDDPLGGAMVDNGNGNGAVYPGWSSGIQGQQQQGFATGYSPILDSRFKHLW